MKKEDVKIGNIVFYKKNWDGFITQAKVIELKPSPTTEDDYYVKLKNICHPELTKKIFYIMQPELHSVLYMKFTKVWMNLKLE